nr:beta-lactamase family protein [Mesorhizobium sp. M7A.F.Ca.MR.362.00.0.0]
MTVLTAGRADVISGEALGVDQYMRIASISKAFNGAIALHLVQKGRLGLDDTIGQHLPDLPAAWSGRHGPPDAEPHQRPARLLAVQGLGRAGRDKSSRLRAAH